MLAVMRELDEPPSSALVTISGMASGLLAGGTGNPIMMVDCGAPGRSVTSRTRCGFGVGTFSARAGPLLIHVPMLLEIAFFTAATSNLPATYTEVRLGLKFAPT